jgi:hypothetical protein
LNPPIIPNPQYPEGFLGDLGVLCAKQCSLFARLPRRRSKGTDPILCRLSPANLRAKPHGETPAPLWRGRGVLAAFNLRALPADKSCMKWLRLPLLAASLLAPALAQRVGAPTDDLTKVGVDELFSVQVTSVGRKAQKISKSPASVFVLTAEDIRRSGATSIPEALRWVPGMTVLSLDGRSWDVSIRGSARLYSDKILVMIDGRSLYTPLFSGVIWDAIDVP